MNQSPISPAIRSRALGVLLVCVLAALAVVGTLAAARAAGYEWMTVPTASMSPTVSPGSVILVDTDVPLGGLRTGDIVAVHGVISGEQLTLIKRLVAIGATDGSTVVEGRDGKVFVDGAVLDERYLPAGTSTREFSARHLAAGEMFVVGDNRVNSRDSIDDGPVPGEALVGKVVVISDPFPSLVS